MYKLLKDTHLMLGVFCCLFLLMYGVSAVQMAHSDWFSGRPTITTTEASLPANGTDARVVAREVMAQHGISGELERIRATPGKLTFNIVRPGNTAQVAYLEATGEATIRDSRAPFMGLLNRLHHAFGIRYRYWWANVWGIFAAIVSVALFLIGLTGVYLWFKIHTERVVGVILLVLSLGYSLTLIFLIRLAH